MTSAYASTIAALVGSTLGGLTSIASAWLTQHRQDRAARLLQDRARRRELYAQFINEASRLYADALAHNEAEISSLVGVYSLISQMRILSSPGVVERAEELIRMIVGTYFTPNKTLPELRHLIDSHTLDPLRRFSEECRMELGGV
ncbi:hypothetical protein [Bradyrhizobium symbiodeficiens]|uniref:Uncharacterized protein n=1 Tax=Bradyrhizobium symbiodeficiens TaxID=1404367 RepID=A0A6G8ZYZ0_9BRAD|nr:hypothetical protein [Bradyrhizobium symbiodeficiens]QIP05193.1 hypothetical protein HAV00_02530 [Bradyrhizobium symbiodeficiens]